MAQNPILFFRYSAMSVGKLGFGFYVLLCQACAYFLTVEIVGLGIWEWAGIVQGGAACYVFSIIIAEAVSLLFFGGIIAPVFAYFVTVG